MRKVVRMISEEWLSDAKQQHVVRKLLEETEKEDKLLRLREQAPQQPEMANNLKHTRQKISDLMELASTMSRENSGRGNGSVAHRQALIAKEVSPRARKRIPFQPKEEQGVVSF